MKKRKLTPENKISAVREKCPNKEFFLLRIFPYSDQKKLCIWTFFTECVLSAVLVIFKKQSHLSFSRGWSPFSHASTTNISGPFSKQKCFYAVSVVARDCSFTRPSSSLILLKASTFFHLSFQTTFFSVFLALFMCKINSNFLKIQQIRWQVVR